MASPHSRNRVSRLPQWPPPAKREESESPPPSSAGHAPPVPAPRTSISPPAATRTPPRSFKDKDRPPAPLPNEQPPLPPRDVIRGPGSEPPASPRISRHPPPRPPAPQVGENFGSCLQTCFEAINKRHDDELRALESLRVHIFNRAKADKEYAESLAKANNRATKGIANLNQGSTIVQVSKVYLCV